MSRIVSLAMVVLLALLADSAAAHDYWLSPQTYRPRVGKPVPVRLLVGDKFVSEVERPLQKPRTVRFRLLDARGKSTDLLAVGRDGQKPLVQLNLKHRGAHLLALERDWAVIEMTGEKFHKYLEHEGLNNVIRLREAAGEAKQPARERYRRYLKTLLLGDGVGGDIWSQRLGHKLEILPLADPSAVKPGKSLAARILFQSRPLAGAQVAAFGRRGKQITIVTARTDKKGRVKLKIDHSGEWIVRLVHMRRCSEPKEADWESFWAALTFGVAEGKAAAP